jgi:hypothetical protein
MVLVNSWGSTEESILGLKNGFVFEFVRYIDNDMTTGHQAFITTMTNSNFIVT